MIETEKQVIHNFNSGPSILPREVFEEASAAVLDFNNTGLSILEIGHRTQEFESIMDEARLLVRELMKLDVDHEVLFLHGGATTQFMQVPMNLLDDGETAAYCDNGIWGSKAIKEANISGSGKGSLKVDASLFAGGIYQYSLYADGKLIETKQMIVAK